jgi:hypothetical protein
MKLTAEGVETLLKVLWVKSGGTRELEELEVILA